MTTEEELRVRNAVLGGKMSILNTAEKSIHTIKMEGRLTMQITDLYARTLYRDLGLSLGVEDASASRPKERDEYPTNVSAEELKRLQELDMQHKRGDFRQGNY